MKDREPTKGELESIEKNGIEDFGEEISTTKEMEDLDGMLVLREVGFRNR